MLKPLIDNKFNRLIFNNGIDTDEVDDMDEVDHADKYELDDGQIEEDDEVKPVLQFVDEQQLYVNSYVWPLIV